MNATSRPAPGVVHAAATRTRPALWMIVSFVLTLLAIADSAYLTWVHYQPQDLVCTVNGGCHTVQSSTYATLGPVPVALLGLAMYVVILALGILRWRRPDMAPYASVAIFGLVLAGVIYYGYLTHIELNVLNAICQWCVICAVLTVGLLITEAFGLWKQFGAIDDLGDGD